MQAEIEKKILLLPLWSGPIQISSLCGGRTNDNYLVTDSRGKYVVRFGDDIPEHHVMRFNEHAAARAAHLAGLSPELFYTAKGFSVLAYIDGYTLQETDVAKPQYLSRIVDLMRVCHSDIPAYLRGPVLSFNVFHVVHDYAVRLTATNSSYAPLMPGFLETSAQLQSAVGSVDLVFGHNDWMAANILDDGTRLWLIDWDYAGFNSPFFDLGGLAANNGLPEIDERVMLAQYFREPVAKEVWARYRAMKCAALLRETLWSMVSELTSTLDVDYATYTAENLARFRAALDSYRQDIK